MPIGRLRLIEGEYLIDHRLNAARSYRTAHRLEHLRRADGDALHVGATGKDQSGIEFSGRAAQAADQTDLAADTDGAERAGKRRVALTRSFTILLKIAVLSLPPRRDFVSSYH